MKSLITCCLLIVLTCQVAMSQINYDKRLYERKVTQYTKLKKTGTVIGFAGGVLTIAGIAMVSSADWYTDYNGQTTTEDPNGALGLMAVLVGVPATVTGVVLAIIGNKKQKYYLNKLNDVSAGYFQQNGAHGLTLTVRF